MLTSTFAINTPEDFLQTPEDYLKTPITTNAWVGVNQHRKISLEKIAYVGQEAGAALVCGGQNSPLRPEIPRPSSPSTPGSAWAQPPYLYLRNRG